MLRHAREFLNGKNGSWKVGRKWKTTKVLVALKHQKPKKILRKAVKLFCKIDV
jgi:hypothetical protein